MIRLPETSMKTKHRHESKAKKQALIQDYAYKFLSHERLKFAISNGSARWSSKESGNSTTDLSIIDYSGRQMIDAIRQMQKLVAIPLRVSVWAELENLTP